MPGKAGRGISTSKLGQGFTPICHYGEPGILSGLTRRFYKFVIESSKAEAIHEKDSKSKLSHYQDGKILKQVQNDIIVIQRCEAPKNLINKRSFTFVQDDKKKAAFTLAEVLITLGIIGVVAAMTLPVLLSDTKEVEFTTRAKKAYSQILQAIKIYEAQNGTPGDFRTLFEAKNQTANSAQLAEDFSKYFKGAVVCKTRNDTGCGRFFYKIEYATPVVDNEGTYVDTEMSSPKVILADETVIGLTQYNYCYEERQAQVYDDNGVAQTNPDGSPMMKTYYSACANIIFDTNGPKRPNKFGIDVFKLYAYPPNDLQLTGSKSEGSESFHNLLTNGKLKYENYKPGEKIDF